MDLHAQIMNLQTPPSLTFSGGTSPFLAYKDGHRDARHAAAELAMTADACVDALRAIDARLRECARLGLTAAEAYDSFYQETAAEALHGLDSLPLVSG